MSTPKIESEAWAVDDAPVPEIGELSITTSDPSNTAIYTSVSSFEELGLDPSLLKGIYAMGFEKPSKIQETALPMLLASPPKNLVGQSQAGTGKTAAFVLTMLTRVDTKEKCPQAVCLAPSRYTI